MNKADEILAKRRINLSLEEGRRIADEVIARLKPYCSRVEVAGSIRRECHFVNDVDIVLIPQEPLGMAGLLAVISDMGEIAANGPKIKRLLYHGVEVDLYIGTPEICATLLLIRTGSMRSNIRLCGIAKAKGWYLKADGEGLLNEAGQRIAGDTESSIYDALGLKYQQPTERD